MLIEKEFPGNVQKSENKSKNGKIDWTNEKTENCSSEREAS